MKNKFTTKIQLENRKDIVIYIVESGVKHNQTHKQTNRQWYFLFLILFQQGVDIFRK